MWFAYLLCYSCSCIFPCPCILLMRQTIHGSNPSTFRCPIPFSFLPFSFFATHAMHVPIPLFSLHALCIHFFFFFATHAPVPLFHIHIRFSRHTRSHTPFFFSCAVLAFFSYSPSIPLFLSSYFLVCCLRFGRLPCPLFFTCIVHTSFLLITLSDKFHSRYSTVQCRHFLLPRDNWLVAAKRS